MAKVEIDEEELLHHRNRAATLAAIMSNPEARLLAEKAYKLVDPKAPTPTLSAQEQLQQAIEPIQKTVNDFIASQREKDEKNENDAKIMRLQQQWNEGVARLKKDGWTEEGIKALEKIREEKGILDPDDAAAIFEKHNPPPPLASPNGHGGAWNFMEMPTDGDADLKRLIETKGESMPLLNKMVSDGLAEIRGSQPRR